MPRRYGLRPVQWEAVCPSCRRHAGKVESAVGAAQVWWYARIQRRTFHTENSMQVSASTVYREPPQAEKGSTTGLADMPQLWMTCLDDRRHPVGTLGFKVPLAELACPGSTTSGPPGQAGGSDVQNPTGACSPRTVQKESHASPSHVPSRRSAAWTAAEPFSQTSVKATARA